MRDGGHYNWVVVWPPFVSPARSRQHGHGKPERRSQMTAASIRGLLLAVAISILATPLYAQEATFTGTATDSTGSVLPGVTITAVHEASGNVFTSATDEHGQFRLPVRVG